MRHHHFAVLQCPMNLYEAGALLTPNTGVAEREGIAVLVNRPLNAMSTTQSGVIRLTDFPLEGEPVDFDRQCHAAAELEAEYRESIAPGLPQNGYGKAPADFFTWAAKLPRIRPHIQRLQHWEQIEAQLIAPPDESSHASPLATSDWYGSRGVGELARSLRAAVTHLAGWAPSRSHCAKPRANLVDFGGN